MDARYQERVSNEAAEKRWASLPLPGPEEHQLVQWWTNCNNLARVLGHLDGKRFRAVFLTIVSVHHSATIAHQGTGSEEGNTLLKKEQARGQLFSATECYNFVLQRLKTRRKVAQRAALIRSNPPQHSPLVPVSQVAEILLGISGGISGGIPAPPLCLAEDLLRSVEKRTTDLSNQVRSLQTSVTKKFISNPNPNKKPSPYL